MKSIEDACTDSERKKDILVVMQNICEENEFVLANYYIQLKGSVDKMTCKDQPYVCCSGMDGLDEFQEISTQTEQLKGQGIVGRVWENEKYEWNKNIQYESSDYYKRKFHAVDADLKTCLCVAHIDGGELVGVIEFFLQEEWYEVEGIVEKVRFYL